MRELSLGCPRCATKFRVRIDELDLQFRCKNCRASFYVNSGGKCILGKAPQAETVGAAPRKADNWASDPLGPLITGIVKIPYNVRLVIGGLSFLVLAFSVFLWLTGSDEQPLPTSLEDRTQFVARAFVDNDLKQLTRVASPGTSRLLKQWLEEARPDYWGANLTGASVLVSSEVLNQNPRTGMACVVASLTREPSQEEQTPTAPPGMNPAVALKTTPLTTARMGGFELLLYWVLDSSGQWLLDVERVLKNSTAS